VKQAASGASALALRAPSDAPDTAHRYPNQPSRNRTEDPTRFPFLIDAAIWCRILIAVHTEKGPLIAVLCTATIRAVAQGVVGIAFIQMMLIGVAFVIKGIPAAGPLALAVLLLGIMQLPATLITIPVIIFVFATEGASVATIIFSIYVFIAGLADNVLKPLLLGRGVDVPMPVVLIGALGGMVTGGVIGLFIGPVVLAVGYQLFWQWVEDQQHCDGRGDQKQI
jgi:predicted PurR-regulated permease PerM